MLGTSDALIPLPRHSRPSPARPVCVQFHPVEGLGLRHGGAVDVVGGNGVVAVGHRGERFSQLPLPPVGAEGLHVRVRLPAVNLQTLHARRHAAWKLHGLASGLVSHLFLHVSSAGKRGFESLRRIASSRAHLSRARHLESFLRRHVRPMVQVLCTALVTLAVVHAGIVVLLVQEVNVTLPQMVDARRRQSDARRGQGGRPELEIDDGEEEDGENKHVEACTEVEDRQLASTKVEEDVGGVDEHRHEEV
eukprot:767440-Hanusia_phi.AAC.1